MLGSKNRQVWFGKFRLESFVIASLYTHTIVQLIPNAQSKLNDREVHPASTLFYLVPVPLVNLSKHHQSVTALSIVSICSKLCTYLFHISPKTPAPRGMVCSSQLALRAAALSLVGLRFISVILLNLVASDCVAVLVGGRLIVEAI